MQFANRREEVQDILIVRSAAHVGREVSPCKMVALVVAALPKDAIGDVVNLALVSDVSWASFFPVEARQVLKTETAAWGNLRRHRLAFGFRSRG